MTLVIAYYMDPNWTLPQEHLAFDKVDNLFFSYLQC